MHVQSVQKYCFHCQICKSVGFLLPSWLRRTHCFFANMETTVPFGRAISVRQLPFAILSDNVFWNRCICSWFNVSYLLSTFKVIFVVVQLLFFWITVFTKQGNEDISIGSSSPLIPSVYVNLILVICDVRLNQLIGCHTMPKKRLKTLKFSTRYKALISFLR